MIELPENAYLDFLERSEAQHVKSIFLEDWRPQERVIYDDEGRFTARFLSDALSTLPNRDADSYADYHINEFSRGLQRLIKAGPGRSMSRDLFELYMPTLPKLNFERMPADERSARRLDPFDFYVEFEAPLQRDLRSAIAQMSFPPSISNDEISKALRDFTTTVENLLGAAWRGRRYEIVTGLPKLDDWLAEVQTALTEFTLPNGLADELLNRKLITDLINSEEHNMLARIFSQLDAPLVIELKTIPLTTIVGFTGEALVTGVSREDAVSMLDAYAVAKAERYRFDGLGESRDFLKTPEIRLAEKKAAAFKKLTGFWRRRA